MKLLQYLKVVLLCGIKVIYYHFHYIVKFVKHPEKYPLEYRYKIVRKELNFVFNKFNIKTNVKNIELFTNLNEKSLIISNHLSLIDPILLIMQSEKPITFIAKKEVKKIPFVGKVAQAIEVFFIDRENLMSQVSQIKNICSYLRDPNKPSVIVYIEGTRNKNPENPCLDFHPGTLKIAQMANCPIISFAGYGTFRILDKKSHIKPYPAYMSFLNIYPKEVVKAKNTTEFACELKQEVDNEVDNLRKLDKEFILNSKISEKHKLLETRFDVRADS